MSRFFYRPRRSHNNGGQSDAESDASGISWASGLHSSHRRRNESGSESERSVRRTHRSRRKRYITFFFACQKNARLWFFFSLWRKQSKTLQKTALWKWPLCYYSTLLVKNCRWVWLLTSKRILLLYFWIQAACLSICILRDTTASSSSQQVCLIQ